MKFSLIVLLILFHFKPNIYVHSSSFLSNHLKFLKNLEPVEITIEKHHHSKDRKKRFLDDTSNSMITMRLKTLTMEFEVRLGKLSRSQFESDIFLLNNKEISNQDYLSKIYEGSLVDEPHDSRVSGTFIGELFYGKIVSLRHGTFFLESAMPFFHLNEPILYNFSNINFTNNLDIHNVDPIKMQSTFLNRFKEIIDFSKIWPDNDNNAPKKRPERLHFPESRCVCDLSIQIDRSFYNEIFKNEGNKNQANTLQYIAFFLNAQVEFLNEVFNDLNFLNSYQTEFYTGVRFAIHKAKIFTNEMCQKDSLDLECSLSSNTSSDNILIDESTYLDRISLQNHSSHCLAYTFTTIDFPGTPIGVAWLAKDDSRLQSGYCAKYEYHKGQLMSLNTGLVSIVSQGKRLPLLTSQLTFAHEVGHSFGANHDPATSGNDECSPGDAKGGNYIMYYSTMIGRLKNNRNFSKCSRKSMGPIMHRIVQDSDKFCFKKHKGPLCGNQIVEEGEECDCGYEEDCKDTCCYHASHEKSHLRCRLRRGAQCSPTRGNCCGNDCKFKSSTHVCIKDNHCLYDVNCTGYSAVCPSRQPKFFKPNFSFCSSQSQFCIDGECTGTVCEENGMRYCSPKANIWNKSEDRSKMCHVACVGELTKFQCIDAFEIESIRRLKYNQSLLILPPGSICANGMGFCDFKHKCQPIMTRGHISKTFVLIEVIYQTLIQKNFWTVFIVFMFTWSCLVHVCIKYLSPKPGRIFHQVYDSNSVVVGVGNSSSSSSTSSSLREISRRK